MDRENWELYEALIPYKFAALLFTLLLWAVGWPLMFVMGGVYGTILLSGLVGVVEWYRWSGEEND